MYIIDFILITTIVWMIVWYWIDAEEDRLEIEKYIRNIDESFYDLKHGIEKIKEENEKLKQTLRELK